MDVYDLFAKLTLDTSNYEEGLDDAKKTADKGGSKIGKALGTAAKVSAAALAAASGAVVAFGKSSVAAGKTFDSSMSQVAATMGDNASKIVEYNGKSIKSIDALREFAQEMGRTTAFSASESADALNYMALAGYDAQTSMKMLPNVLNLAAAGSIDLARASDMITDAQSALGLTVEETTTMVDQMAKTSSTTNTSVEQLGDAILTIGATARGVKGGTAELSAVLGILADNGIKGAEGGTHLRNAILSLQTPTEDGTAALKKLGMSYDDMYDSAGNMRSLPDIFQQMSDAMEGMTQQSKDAIISGIFNKTDLAAINALVGTDAKRWDEVTAAIEGAEGAAETMSKVQLNNLEGDVTLFKSALEGAQIAMSDQLTPSLRNFVQFGTEGLAKVTEAFGEGGISGAMGALGDVIGEGISMIIEKLPDMMNAGKELLAAIGQGILDNLPQITTAAVQVVSMLTSTIIEGLPELLTAGISIINELVSGISEGLPELIPAAAEAIVSIATALTDPGSISSLIEGGLSLMMALASGLIDAIPTLIEAIPEIVKNLVTALTDNSMELLGGAAALIAALATGLIEGIPMLVGSIPEIIAAIAGGLVDGVKQFTEIGGDFVQGLVDGISEKWDGVVETVSGFFDGLVGRVKGLLGIHSPSTVFKEMGENTVKGYGEGVDEESPSLLTKVSDFANSVIDAASKVFNGAKNVAGKAAGFLGRLLGFGDDSEVEAAEADAAKAGEETKLAMVGALEGMDSDVSGIFASMIALSVPSMEELQQAWDEATTEVADKTDTFSESLNTSFTKLTRNLDKFIDNIKTKFNAFKQACRNLSDEIKNMFNFTFTQPHLALPHINYTLITVPGLGTFPDPSTLSVDWYKKAYETPYMFTKPTLMGFGDGVGGEIVYGHDQLMEDIKEAIESGGKAGSEVVLNYDKLAKMIGRGNQTVINITVNPSPGMDEKSLAKMVARQIQMQVNQKGAVWA